MNEAVLELMLTIVMALFMILGLRGCRKENEK